MESNEVKKQITARSQKGNEVPAMWSEGDAREYFESRRWPDGPRCPHDGCGSENVYRVGGKSHRKGLLECRACRKQFTVTVGTVMEDSHLPLKIWAMAFHLITTSKKGYSALQLQRNLGLGSYRTAWFLGHRIREAMRAEPISGMLKGVVEIDETYVGGKPRRGGDGSKTGKGHTGRGTPKKPVMVLVEKNGNAISMPIEHADGKTLIGAAKKFVDPSSTIMTDEWPGYSRIGQSFEGGHKVVKHSTGQYVGPNGETTNNAESFFALLKRGHYGVYHQMSKKHLHRYSDEFGFRWNGRELEDVNRRNAAVDGAEGKRLYYKTPVSKQDGNC